MIWIIGGTKDSRIILDEVMKVREDDIIVSTATEYGGKLLEGVAKNKNIQYYKVKTAFEKAGLLSLQL